MVSSFVYIFVVHLKMEQDKSLLNLYKNPSGAIHKERRRKYLENLNRPRYGPVLCLTREMLQDKLRKICR